jgi:transcriptional repressor NrdR
MKCPTCSSQNTEVKDSRAVENGVLVRRRRICKKCKHRFSTIERIYHKEILVVKRSGMVRKFDPEKIEKSIATALRKRPIKDKTISQMVDSIVGKIENYPKIQIPAKKIGEMILEELHKVDQVAYIRFASVYKDFTSAKDFAEFIGKMGG